MSAICSASRLHSNFRVHFNVVLNFPQLFIAVSSRQAFSPLEFGAADLPYPAVGWSLVVCNDEALDGFKTIHVHESLTIAYFPPKFEEPLSARKFQARLPE